MPHISILVVAALSIDPPGSGMAAMNRTLLATDLAPISLIHVDASMCRTMAEMHRMDIVKVLRLVLLPFRLLAQGIHHDSHRLLFVPSSPSLSGCLKDLWVIGLTRWWFRQRVYHLHSAGIGVFLAQQGGLVGCVLRAGLGRPTAVIRLAETTPPDQLGFEAQHAAILPNCLVDEAGLLAIDRSSAARPGGLKALFIGLHIRSKGLMTALEALELAAHAGQRIELHTIGSFNDPGFEVECRAFCRERGLEDQVVFHGPQYGQGKLGLLAQCQAVVFPTMFPCEALPLVVMEAMAAALPVVASRWSGIPSLIRDGVDGLLTEPGSATETAVHLGRLAADPALQRALGQSGRIRYLEHFSCAAFRQRAPQVFGQCLGLTDRGPQS